MGGRLPRLRVGELSARPMAVGRRRRCAAAVRARGCSRAAEAMAIENGAARATLDTFNPPAKAFYLRQGYEVFGTLDDYPPGFSKFFLRKTLFGPGAVPGR